MENNNDVTKTPVCSCCCTKHTDRSEAERKKLVNRLKRIEGQIRGIIGMLENDAYCNEIIEKKFSQQNKVLGNIEKFA